MVESTTTITVLGALSRMLLIR
jgi:hypothetical protein